MALCGWTAPGPAAPRPPAGHAPAPPSRVLVTLYYRDRPFGPDFTDFFERQARPVLTATGATPLSCLRTEYAENTFPALPVRTGEHVYARFAHDHGRAAAPTARPDRPVPAALRAPAARSPSVSGTTV
jgi:hypothetical protein